jgi:hypothetical protein
VNVISHNQNYYNAFGFVNYILKSDCEIVNETETTSAPPTIDIRKQIAAQIMAGYAANSGWINADKDEKVSSAIEEADELLKQLSKTNPTT